MSHTVHVKVCRNVAIIGRSGDIAKSINEANLGDDPAGETPPAELPHGWKETGSLDGDLLGRVFTKKEGRKKFVVSLLDTSEFSNVNRSGEEQWTVFSTSKDSVQQFLADFGSKTKIMTTAPVKSWW